VRSSERPTLSVLSIEQSHSMATVRDAIIHDKLNDDCEGCLLTVGDILTIRTKDHTKIADTFSHSCPIRAVMASESLLASVFSVELSRHRKRIIPFQRTDRRNILQELYGFFDNSGSLIREEGNFTRNLVEQTIESRKSFFKIWNEPSGICPDATVDPNYLLIHR